MTQIIQNTASGKTADHLAAFQLAGTGPHDPAWLAPIRQTAITRFAELGFPTVNDEDWRFTNVAPIAALPFKPALNFSANGVDSAVVAKNSFTTLKASRLVFVNGLFARELSSILPSATGVKISSLADAFRAHPDLLEKHLARHAHGGDTAFTALNTAFFRDGAFIHVPAGITVAEPVHLLFISTEPGPGATSNPRNLIIAEKNSRLTVIESFVGESGAYFTNAVEELILGENAVVEHCKFQDESQSAFHIAAIHAHLGRHCNFIAHSIATGARLSRNNIRTSLADEGVECILNGLYLTRDEQLADHHMIVEHAKPHCNSHEYYNGILDGRSRGVFHGRILVRPDAQKTDAKQTNKNLLLSDDAMADTKPQLEIYADDVKCTHGATVGQLNDESIFYLRARGIGLETARRMLIHAFAGEIIDRVRCAPAREELDKIVWDRLEQNSLGEKK
jgi:Fe-S cluster assembly protein SufD